jgi:hypothetical protein
MSSSLGLMLLCATVLGGDLQDQFTQDLRNPKYPPENVLAVAKGEGAQKVVKREAGGLRVTLSGKPSGFPPLGVAPRFRVSGDFEITGSFEIIKLEKPASGYGVSVSLWVTTDTPNGAAATLTRSHRPWDGNVWVADKGWLSADGQYQHDQEAVPTQCRSGQLRLARTGSVLHYLVADNDSGEFHEVRQIPFSKEDLAQIHFGVDTGGSASPVDVRLRDLSIRAAELPFGASRKQTMSAWLIWLFAGVVGLGVVLAGGFWFRKTKQARADG